MATKAGQAHIKDARAGKTLWEVKTLNGNAGNSMVQEVRPTHILKCFFRKTSVTPIFFMHVDEANKGCYKYTPFSALDIPTGFSPETKTWFFVTRSAAINFARRLLFVTNHCATEKLLRQLTGPWRGPGAWKPWTITWTIPYSADYDNRMKKWIDSILAPIMLDPALVDVDHSGMEKYKSSLDSVVIGVDPATGPEQVVLANYKKQDDGTLQITNIENVK